MLNTSVKYFHSSMPSAPVIPGVAGTRIAAIEACLITGWGLQTAASVTVAGGVATVGLPGGHVFEPDVVALVSGANPAELNGEKRLLTTATGAVTFDAQGIADQVATGTITIKLAPVGGWEKVFTGANVAVFRSTDVEGSRKFYRFDDSGATNVRVTGYETMSDAVTGIGAFPSAVQINGGGYWPAASAASEAPRAWTLAADSKGGILHLHTAPSSPGASGCIWEFGDFKPRKSGDAYAARLQCAKSDIASSNAPATAASSWCGITGTDLGAYLPRSFTTLGGSVEAAHGVEGLFSAAKVSGAAPGSGMTPNYPNGPGNELFTVRKTIVEPGVALRGFSRGLHVTPQNCHTAFNWRDKVDGQGELVGRKLMAIKCGSPAGVVSEGVAFIDIIGPWS